MRFLLFLFLIFVIASDADIKPHSADYASLTGDDFQAGMAELGLNVDLQNILFAPQFNEDFSWHLHHPSGIPFLQRTFKASIPERFFEHLDSAFVRSMLKGWLEGFIANHPEILPDNLRQRAQELKPTDYIDFAWTISPIFYHPRQRLSFMVTVTAFDKPIMVFARAIYITDSDVYILEIHSPFKERLRRVFEEICRHFRLEEETEGSQTGLYSSPSLRSQDFWRVCLLPPLDNLEFQSLLQSQSSSIEKYSAKIGIFIILFSILFFVFLPGRR